MLQLIRIEIMLLLVLLYLFRKIQPIIKIDLKDRITPITGADSGIGKATAKIFAQSGALVMLNDKDEDELKKTYDALKRS